MAIELLSALLVSVVSGVAINIIYDKMKKH